MEGSKSNMLPRPMSELLPSLSGILPTETGLMLTAKKQPRSTMVHLRTADKMKPLTLAEIKADIQSLKPQSARRQTQALPSAKKKGWNSSIKVDVKKINHTADGHLKNNPVRKVLNFQPKPKTMPTQQLASETPKFPKPESRAKKALHLFKDKNSVRISGICNIPPTPVTTSKPRLTSHIQSRLTVANKENNYNHINLTKKALTTPIHQKLALKNLDTPLSNSSWKSGSDASFLQKEKEIHDIEAKVNAIAEEQTLENIAEVSPPVSTPFKEYRSVQEYFNDSTGIDMSVAADNTIMCFDKPTVCNDNGKKEESSILSLCDLFHKATVNTAPVSNTELDNLLEVESQTKNNIKMLETGIQMFTKIKESHIKSLRNVQMLIREKKDQQKQSGCDKDKTLVATQDDKEKEVINETLSPVKSPILSRPCSVIKSTKSPSYKIPKKNPCLRKKLIYKSMPNMSSGMQTPVKDIEGRALNMYMNLKEQMNFLSTPMVNRDTQVPDTPAVTSHNLQKQLDKLFGS